MSEPSSARPEFERLEAWCRDSRRWRVASGLVPLLVGLATIAMASRAEGLEAQVQWGFGAALCVAAMLPGVQALERSEWLRLLAALRERWDAQGDAEARRGVEATLRRLTTERMGARP